jgi:hypothetical protein
MPPSAFADTMGRGKAAAEHGGDWSAVALILSSSTFEVASTFACANGSICATPPRSPPTRTPTDTESARLNRLVNRRSCGGVASPTDSPCFIGAGGLPCCLWGGAILSVQVDHVAGEKRPPTSSKVQSELDTRSPRILLVSKEPLKRPGLRVSGNEFPPKIRRPNKTQSRFGPRGFIEGYHS